MKNKKHLLILTPGFPTNEEDTRCIPALQLFLKELNARDLFEICIISFHYPYKPKEYNWNGMKVHALGGNNKKGLSRLLLLNKAKKISESIHKKHKFDYIHSFWFGECAWIGNQLSKKFKLNHSVTLMGQDALGNNKYLKKINLIPKLITLSKFHEETLLKSSGIKSDFRIPWGVEYTSTSTNKKEIDVLGVGNITELKNFERFLEIIYSLKEQHPNLNVLIIGEGNTIKLKELINKLELNKNVYLLSERNREEVLEKMRASKCLLHCSQYESFGMVVPEALSCGAAVFSTPVGIAPEIKEVKLFHSNEEAMKQIHEFLMSKKKLEIKETHPITTTVDSYINSVFLA